MTNHFSQIAFDSFQASYRPEMLSLRERGTQQSLDGFANLLNHKPYDDTCIAPVQP